MSDPGYWAVCDSDGYTPSSLENHFRERSLWNHPTEACESPGFNASLRKAWISQNLGDAPPSTYIFSRFCEKGKQPRLIEPLAGFLRDPRFVCDATDPSTAFSIDWLLIADSTVLQPGAKKIFFDAGATKFGDAMKFFASHYEKRGIVFDEIYAWEAVAQPEGAYWEGVSEELRAKWEKKVTFYNGVPITKESGDHNVVERIIQMCKPEDFCAFKLDIDTPSVEVPIVEQLIASPLATAAMDEFFFEHHVHGVFQNYGWGQGVEGTYDDSHRMFSQLRHKGVRAHSWI